MQLRYAVRGAIWLILYLFFILAPLFALLAGSIPPARDFWTEFSVAIGYSGLAIMGLQFGLTARFRYVTEPWGEDVIYHFHRQISLIAVGLVVAHPIILFIIRPELLALLNSIPAPWRARFAALSTYSLIALVVMALWRTKLKISYETWHLTHIVLAVVAVTAGILHMVGWSFYLGRPLEARAVDRPDDLLDRAAAVRPHRQAAVHPPPAVPRLRGAQGARRHLDVGDAAGRSPRFPLPPWPVRLADGVGEPIQDHRAPVFVFVERGGRRTAASRCRSGSWATSRARFDKVPVGQRVYIDGPYGAFTIGNPADMHVLIAGGVGITPMMSMIRTLADQGDKRPVILLYGSKDWESITFREELEALKERLDLTVVHVLEDPPDGWTGERGFINAEVFKRHLPPPYADHEYFICGPDVMMDAIETALGQMKVPMSKYHSERYSFV